MKPMIVLQLLSAAVREDGYELSLTVTFALRGASVPDPGASYDRLPTGARKPVRRSSLTRYASQESLGKCSVLFQAETIFFANFFLQVYIVTRLLTNCLLSSDYCKWVVLAFRSDVFFIFVAFALLCSSETSTCVVCKTLPGVTKTWPTWLNDKYRGRSMFINYT